jgi:hypothetical protein
VASSRGHAGGPGAALRAWELAPALLLATALLFLAREAFATQRLLDLKLAYNAGVEAWLSGRPENVETWMGTPVLAVAMAALSLLLPLRVAEVLFTAGNLGLAALILFLVWRRLRGDLPRGLWWATLVGAALFAPLLSTIAYRQFNLIVFGLALGGFAALRRGHDTPGAVLIALSVALKPLALLLPVALLLRRETRRAALLACGGVAILSLAALVLLALRAGDSGLLSPLDVLRNFNARARPWLAHTANVSPLALLVRDAPQLVPRELPALRAVTLLALALVGALLNDALRDRSGRSWELFAAACALSPMLGAIAWPHYGVLQAPLFLLLTLQLARRHAPASFWALLVLAYALVQLVVPPVGTAAGHVSVAVSGAKPTRLEVVRDQTLSQLGQYFLLLAALAWFQRERGIRLSAPSVPEAGRSS